jgi:cytochrome c553
MATERDEAHKQVLSALNAACEVYAMEAQATSAKYYEKALARAEASSSDPKKEVCAFCHYDQTKGTH